LYRFSPFLLLSIKVKNMGSMRVLLSRGLLAEARGSIDPWAARHGGELALLLGATTDPAGPLLT
jgi:hypothetical protein